MCTLITSKGTDIDENIANQNHATRTPKPGCLNLSNLSITYVRSRRSRCLFMIDRGFERAKFESLFVTIQVHSRFKNTASASLSLNKATLYSQQ
jgi:hypothetical protein